ncbi:hypothetical protein D3C83_245040 [compost metagenome]
MHWGTFDLADDGVDEPPRVLAELLARPESAAVRPRVVVPAVGETLDLAPRRAERSSAD